MQTATRRPGASSAMAARSCANPAAVVADLHRRDRPTGRVRDLYLMSVPVGVDPDDGIYHLCQHGHVASRLLPGLGPTSAPAWVESPGGISVMGHASRRTGF